MTQAPTMVQETYSLLVMAFGRMDLMGDEELTDLNKLLRQAANTAPDIDAMMLLTKAVDLYRDKPVGEFGFIVNFEVRKMGAIGVFELKEVKVMANTQQGAVIYAADILHTTGFETRNAITCKRV